MVEEEKQNVYYGSRIGVSLPPATQLLLLAMPDGY
jgi:hypothetical protein